MIPAWVDKMEIENAQLNAELARLRAVRINWAEVRDKCERRRMAPQESPWVTGTLEEATSWDSLLLARVVDAQLKAKLEEQQG